MTGMDKHDEHFVNEYDVKGSTQDSKTLLHNLLLLQD